LDALTHNVKPNYFICNQGWFCGGNCPTMCDPLCGKTRKQRKGPASYIVSKWIGSISNASRIFASCVLSV